VKVDKKEKMERDLMFTPVNTNTWSKTYQNENNSSWL